MRKLRIIKIGGNIIDDKKRLSEFLEQFATIKEAKILIHGGGKLATSLADSLGIKQTIIEGRRITDAETLDITVMVYAGLINKNIVAKLQMLNCNAIGLCGADGNIIKCEKRKHHAIDFGFVGDILPDGVNTTELMDMLDKGKIPVLSPITHDGNGNLLNTNADTLASKIAIAMAAHFDVTLTYCFEKKGVLKEVENEQSYLPEINRAYYRQLRSLNIISNGMIPKLDNAFDALEQGVGIVEICQAENVNPNSETAFIGTTLKL